ncbi:MAG: hypothetical protein H8D23_18540 [Candidatus Brocadiales bacterium]|nr:hypothetical protein [Candidatus Brocadiales bacterium]
MSKRLILAFLVLLTLVIAVLLFAYVNYAPEKDGLTRADYGAIGDYFGGILNPSFALLSFLALLGTISLQVKELESQRLELEMTRKELKASKLAQEKSASELRLQNQLQVHAIRASSLGALIEAASIEAQNTDSVDAKKEALEEIQVFARQLEAEVEAVTGLVPEANERVRNAEEELFGHSSQ